MNMEGSTSRTLMWRGIHLTVTLPPPGDASCPRCAGRKRAHECSLSRSGLPAAFKAADRRLKAAESAKAAAQAEAKEMMVRPKRFAVSGVPPLQLITHDVIVRYQNAELACLRTSSDDELARMRKAWSHERNAALRQARADNGHQVHGIDSQGPFQYGHHGCGDALECVHMHAAEDAIRMQTDADWQEQRSRHNAKVRADEADTRARHAAMLDPTTDSIAAYAHDWHRCADANCGAFFPTKRHVRVQQQCLYPPSAFCVCDSRMDLCNVCLPVRDKTCVLCEETFCRHCNHDHRVWCSAANAHRCGLAPDNAAGGGCKRWAAGHCRSLLTAPGSTDHRCVCGTISCTDCLQPCGHGGPLPHRVGRKTCSGRVCRECASTHV